MDSALIPGTESAGISERESISSFFDHLVCYILECEGQLPLSVIRDSQLTVCIADVVRQFARRLIRTRCFREIHEVLKQKKDRLSKYIARQSGYLVPFVPRNCLTFLSIVCLIFICFPKTRAMAMKEKIKKSTVDCLMMFIFWRRDRIVKQLDSAAREILENGDFDLGMELID